MTISLKHAKESLVADEGNTDLVQPSDWNDEHTLTQATDRILGRVTAGAGATEELTAAQVRTLLNVADGATADQDLSAYQLEPSEGAFVDGDKTKLDGIAAGAAASPLTTKGDIYSYSTGNARLAVGANGQVLSADSSTATGLKWIALAGGGDMAASTYDPNAVGSDAFDMDNMVEGTDTKILTASERSTIAGALQPSAIGVSVQAYDAQLDTWSGVTPSANGQSLVSAADYAAMRTLLDLEAGTDFYSISGADAAFATAAQGTKVDYLTVTQAVDLDQMETDIAALANGMVYKSDWDASSGSFPGAGAAQTGWFYNVSVGGTVDSVEFSAGDSIIATVDNASATTYAANWTKKDQTDAVQSVAGLVGTISDSGLRAAINVENGADVTDTANVTAAGALMDSEITSLASVKAINQGLSTSDSPQFVGVNVGHASDTTITRSAAGVIAVEGVPLFAGIPQNSQSAAYTLVLADAQKHILHPSADTTARTWTIPSNASVAFPIGTVVTFINQNSAGVITIAITTDTMRLAGAGTTGSRTLAANGMATAVKITSTEWIISGNGLT